MFVAAAAGAALAACSDSAFNVALVRPLRIISLSPGDGQVGVPLDAKIAVVFSDEVVEDTIKDPKNFSLSAGEKAVSAEAAYDSKTKTATLTPSKPLSYSVEYTITLGTGILKKDDDTEDGHLPAEVRATFATADPTGLGIVSVVSKSGVFPMPRDAGGGKPDSIVITFSEGVVQAGATLASATSDGNLILEDVTGVADPISGAAIGFVGAAVAYLDSKGAAAPDAPASPGAAGKDNVVVLTPEALPGYATVLRLTLLARDAPDLSGIRSDRATSGGGQLPACVPEEGYSCSGDNHVFVFAVESLPPFAVVSVTPGVRSDTAGGGVRGVAFGTETVTAVFSEDIDCASVTESSFAVAWDSTDPVAPGAGVAGSLLCSGATVTFTAGAPFGYSRDIVLTLSTAIRSARAANANASADPLMGHLPADLAFRFSTIDPPEFRIISSKPGSGGGTLISGNNAGTTKDTVVMTFSEGVQRDVEQLGQNIVVEDVAGAAPAAIAGTLEWNAAEGDDNADLSGKDNTATFTPTANWAYGAKVRITFVGGTPPPLDKLRSDRATVRGGQLKGDETYALEVEGIPDLYVLAIVPGAYSTTPGAGQKGVPAAAQAITATFSEDLDCASVDSTSFAVTYDSTDPAAPGTTVAGALSCNGATVTFTADAAIGFSRDVLATLSTAIRSARAAQADPAVTLGHLAADYPARFSTEDPAAPVVVGMAPGPLSTGVPRASTISVTFNQAMDSASFDSTTFNVCDTLNDAACAQNLCPPAQLVFNVAKDTVTCTPAAPMPYSAVIRVSLAGGAAGLKSAAATARGGWFSPNPDPFSYTFTIENIDPLAVLATNFSGSNGFAIFQQLEFIFSDHVELAGIQGPPARVFLTKSIDNSVVASTLEMPAACTAGNPCKLVLRPSAALEYATTYTAIVLGGFPDGVCVPERTAANSDGCIPAIAIAATAWSGLSFSFTTETTPGLQVVSTAPKDGDTGVVLAPTISVQFNNQLEPSSVSTSTICLTKGSNASTDCAGPAAVALNAWTIKPDGKTIETTPVAILDFNSAYTIVVTKGVFDKYGQTLTSFVTAVFTTLTSALIQDIVVLNPNDLEPPDSLYVRIRFTEAMDQSTLVAANIYITYADEFGETAQVPSIVTSPDAQTAIITPDYRLIAACDGGKPLASGNDGFTDDTRPSRFGSAGTVFSAAYVGKTLFVSGSAAEQGGYFAITGIDAVNPGTDERLILAGANFAASEQRLDWAVLEPVPALPYATNYLLHLATTIKNAAGTKHVEAIPGQKEMTFGFVTGTAPALASVTYENSVLTPANLFGGNDVPVNSMFSAVFNSALDPATVGNATVWLEERRGGDGAAALPNTFTSAMAVFTAADVGKFVVVYDSLSGNAGRYAIGAVASATTVTVSPDFSAAESNVRWGIALDGGAAGVLTLSPDNKTVIYATTALPAGRIGYSTSYRLVIKGRTAANQASILRLADGSPVMGVTGVPFDTSPAMTVKSNPKSGAGLNQMMDFTAMFSRDLNFGSLTDATFFATQQGFGQLTALIAANDEFKNYVTLMPVPTFRASATGAVVTITTGVQDFRGNPMPAETTFTFPVVGNAPATNAIVMELYNSVTPAGGAQISAFQKWVLQFPTNNNLRNIAAPSSFGSNSVKLVESPGGGDSSVVPLVFDVIPNGNVTGDRVEFWPKRELVAAKTYELTLTPANMSNMYRLAIQSANEVRTYTGETTAPALVAPEVTPNGAGQDPKTEVVAWFGEQMDLSSADASTFTVRVNGTAQAISGRYRQEQDTVSGNWKVIFTPSRPLKYAAAGYDVVLGAGLRDAAGNAFAGQTFANRFSINNTAPRLVSGSPTGAAVAASSPLVYVFDKEMDPATASSPTSTAAGTVNVTWQDACSASRSVEGCVRMNAGGTQVVYRPATPWLLPSSQTATADFDATKVADLAGNLADKNSVAPWNFTVAPSRPQVTCHAHDAGTGVVEVNFTDDIDGATVTAASFDVFSVATGAPVPGTVVTAAKKVTFTAAAPPLAAGDYGVFAATGIKSTAGQDLLTDWHYYFTVP
jgi:hypothetical protein